MKEVEAKFTLPSTVERAAFLNSVLMLLRQEGYTIGAMRSQSVSIIYYDTPDLLFYVKGMTLRRILRRRTPRFRYDFKTGNHRTRDETKVPSAQALSSQELIRLFKLNVREVVPMVSVMADHLFVPIRIRGALLEMKLDDYSVFSDMRLKEIEFELMAGTRQELAAVSRVMRYGLGLRREYRQKYSRIIELVGLR